MFADLRNSDLKNGAELKGLNLQGPLLCEFSILSLKTKGYYETHDD